jgi:glycerol-3-phosphate dehydrogenase
MWETIPEEVDLVVIGGGITGAGIVRDAARRGLRVVLFEQNDIAYGTSSRSSKLIHGGLRYLESYEFSLVFESVSERRVVMDLAPHLVNPQAFLFPIYQDSGKSLRMISAGMWLYDGLALFRSPKRHRALNPGEVAEEEPLLRQEGLQGSRSKPSSTRPRTVPSWSVGRGSTHWSRTIRDVFPGWS